MARYQVILAYDGTPYQGFQRQVGAETVQGVVERALRVLGWNGQSILAAGRTDTGVHAIGQVIAFDLDWRHTAADLRSAMNANLPMEIAALQVTEVDEDFHPRYAAIARSYRYHIFCQELRHPLRERFAWRVYPEVDLDRLAQAAELIRGKHDFAAFGTPPREGGGTIRHVFEASWRCLQSQWQNPDLIFDITADAFLYRMVRRLVYIQVLVGQARMSLEDLKRLLESPPETVIQGLAPPHGLFLVAVEYRQTKGAKDDLQPLVG